MKGKGVLLIIFATFLIIGIFFAGSYNGFVSAEEELHNKWGQVEVNYQRRIDLIPNLVETVKGYADHESQLFKDVAALRTGYQEAGTPGEYSKLDADLKATIQVAVEAYPELKANENFLSLQDELAGTENRIAVARKDYNESATVFNKKVRTFPGNIFAGLFGFEKVDLFEAQDGAEVAPTVNFN